MRDEKSFFFSLFEIWIQKYWTKIEFKLFAKCIHFGGLEVCLPENRCMYAIRVACLCVSVCVFSWMLFVCIDNTHAVHIVMIYMWRCKQYIYFARKSVRWIELGSVSGAQIVHSKS